MGRSNIVVRVREDMRFARASIIGGILYVALAATWIWYQGTNAGAIQRLGISRIHEDLSLLILAGVILAIVLLVNTRQLRAIQSAHEDARQALRRQQSYVNALAHTANQVTFDRKLPEILQSICGEAAIAMGLDAATIALCDHAHGVLDPVASFGLSDSLRQHFKTVVCPEAELQAASSYGTTVLPVDGSSPLGNLYPDLFRVGGFKTLIHLPLTDAEHRLGSFTGLSLSKGVSFAPEQLALFQGFAAQAALAIHNGRIMTDVRESRMRLEALRHGDLAILSSLDLQTTLHIFVEKVIQHLKVDAADVLLLNPVTQMLEYAAGTGFLTGKLEKSRVLLGTGFAGKIAAERRALFVPDVNAAEPFTRRELILGEGVISYYGAPLVAKGRLLGVLEAFQRTTFAPDGEWTSFLSTLAGQAAIAIDNAALFSSLQQTNVQLSLAYDRTLEGWSRALDLRDKETEGHTERVTELCLRLASALEVPDGEMVHFRRGAMLHDIGKMGVPDHVLLKPGKFDKDDERIMQRHPTLAFEMLAPISFLQAAIDIPYCHHERWDGTGYPRGLKGEAIPLAARIFSVVDVWDALTSDRPYRKALTDYEARQYIREQAGSQFDPHIAERFLQILPQPAGPHPDVELQE